MIVNENTALREDTELKLMGIQNIFGKPGNRIEETVKGSSGDDLIYPLGGYDYIDGALGYDRVHVSGLMENFKLVPAAGGAIGLIDATSAASPMGATLINVEEIVFNNGVIKLDTPDRFVDMPGKSDSFTGGAGLSTVVYPQDRANYEVSKAGRFWKVTELNAGVFDTLDSIERIAFKDKAVAIDLETPAPGSAARDAAQLLCALFSSRFFDDPAHVAITGQVLTALEQKTYSEQQIAQLALDLQLVAGYVPKQIESLVKTVAGNVLQISPQSVSAELVAGLSGMIQSSSAPDAPLSPAAFIVLAADYVKLTGQLSTGLEYLLI